jgi:hypothetical protein
MSPRAAEMAKMLVEQLPRDSSQADVERFVLANFAEDSVADLDLACEIMGEIEDLQDIDAVVEGGAA